MSGSPARGALEGPVRDADEALRVVAWDGVRFALPARLVAQPGDVPTFVEGEPAPSLAVTLATDALVGGPAALLRYVDRQLDALRRAAPGYGVHEQASAPTADGSPALRVVARQGPRRAVQHQLYVLDAPRDRVAVATVTAVETAAARAAAVLSCIAETWAGGAP